MANMAKGHCITGKVAGVTEHHGGKHLSVSIRHGRRSPRKKGDKDSNPFMYDDRPESHLVVPKEHADKYRVGQNVRVRITDPDGDGDMDTDAAAEESKSAASELFRATRGKG